MKALSTQQPRAELILYGLKDAKAGVCGPTTSLL
jgi:hypothetical protein